MSEGTKVKDQISIFEKTNSQVFEKLIFETFIDISAPKESSGKLRYTYRSVIVGNAGVERCHSLSHHFLEINYKKITNFVYTVIVIGYRFALLQLFHISL